jgi:asparagine synthase (glutamine-hydrolysing)
MCGIAGLINAGEHDGLKLVRAMTSIVRHRGPDDEGAVVFGGGDDPPHIYGGSDTPASCFDAGYAYSPPRLAANAADRVRIAFGHRRLSIVDITPAGHQPMCSEDRRHWIVFNGEVYNHIELRRELEARGHRFVSHCDTEVILAAYKEWGSQCLDRFNGMFAFLLYDRSAKILFAARDRFGVKPLYYWISPQGLIAFASEVKQFTVVPGWRPSVNGQRAYDFVNWSLLDHTDETLFAGVHQLRNGEMLELGLDDALRFASRDGAKLPARAWYALKPRPFAGTLQDAAREFRDLFRDSIRLRLRADVPVGSCLSGGLDSSSIVCEVSRMLGAHANRAEQKTFSACAKIRRFDERDFVDEVVRATGVSAHYVYPEPDQLFANLDTLTWHQDEPFGSTSIYAQWHVFALAAASGVKVMLDGQGADEQLAGYHSYFAPRLARLFRSLQWWSLAAEVRACAKLHGYSPAWAAKQLANELLPEVLRQPLRRLAGKPSSAPPWLDMKALNAEPRDPYVAAGQSKNLSVQEVSLAQLTRTNLQMLLHWEDRNSMAHSIESRVPFLDYRLVEFVLGLPEAFKISNGMTKCVMREAMRGVLPERIRTRVDKLGFVTPEQIWLREGNPGAFRNAMKKAVAASAGILRPQVLEMIEHMIAGRIPFDFRVWRMISLGAWLEKFDIGRRAA